MLSLSICGTFKWICALERQKIVSLRNIGPGDVKLSVLFEHIYTQLHNGKLDIKATKYFK